MAKVLIGTSGWTYSSWKGRFYPASLPKTNYLEFYSEHFPITEVNYSFYHLPNVSTYKSWHDQAPKRFLFALKASRYITHTKRLVDVDAAWQKFIDNASNLESHLGPILFQLPATFHIDIERLNNFLTMIKHYQLSYKSLRLVLEFRHQSWFVPEIYDLLSSYKAALCIADSNKYPRHNIVTTKFTYLRFHGRSELFASSYSKEELSDEALLIKQFLAKGTDVYVFFNNDAQGHAIKNALTLKELLAD